MRDYTNLQWPEAPFGAEQRPFGRPADMLAAFALEWTNSTDDGRLPVSAATVYLRVRRHGTAHDVREDTLSIGFRTSVIENETEVPDLLAVVDRALTRARRHAAILAGHNLGNDLTDMIAMPTAPLRGAVGVHEAWADRRTRARGVALAVDTNAEASATGADLDLSLNPLDPPCLCGPACAAALARNTLARCLAIGLTAAVHTGRYRWQGAFRARDVIDRAGWDVLTGDPAPHMRPTGQSTPPERNPR